MNEYKNPSSHRSRFFTSARRIFPLFAMTSKSERRRIKTLRGSIEILRVEINAC